MRAVLKGKTQEFIQGGITPSGLATQVRRGIIKGFDAATYRATVQLLGSLSVWLEGVPVAHYLRPNLVTPGTRCGVAFFDESNPADACLAFTYDNLPPSGDLPLLQGAARSLYIQQKASNTQGDSLSVRAADAGTGPGAYKGGNLYLYGGAGVSGGYHGDVALAYTGSGARGSVGVGGAPPAGQSGRLYTMGYIYPGTGAAIQSTHYLYHDGARLATNSNFRLNASRPHLQALHSGTPLARFGQVDPGRADMAANLWYDGVSWALDDPTVAGSILTQVSGQFLFYNFPVGGPITGILTIEAAGHVRPESAGAQNLGNASYYWNDVSAKSFTDRGCIPYLEPGEAMALVRRAGSSTEAADSPRMKPHNLKRIQYDALPPWVYHDGKRLEPDGSLVQGEKGLDLSGMIGLLLAAVKDLDGRLAAVGA